MNSATPSRRGAKLRHDSAEDKGRATGAEEEGAHRNSLPRSLGNVEAASETKHK